MMMVLNSLGGALRKTGWTDDAIAVFEESLAIGRDLADRRHMMMVLDRLGETLRETGRIDDAMHAFDESLTIRRELEERHHIGTVADDWQFGAVRSQILRKGGYRYGFTSLDDGSQPDVYFREGFVAQDVLERLAQGTEVSVRVEVLPDGRRRARDVRIRGGG